jgi:hypothetical protein
MAPDARPAAAPSARNLDRRTGKPSLTVFCGICAFSHNISADSASSRDLDSQELPPWNLKAPDHRSSNRSNSATC